MSLSRNRPDRERISEYLVRAAVPNLVGRIGDPTNVYFLGGDPCLLIDTGSNDGGTTVLETMNQFEIETLDRIVLTHAHLDHSGAAPIIRETTGADVFLHPEAQPIEMDGTIPIEDGQVFEAGPYRLTAIETPGHAPGHVSLYDANLRLLFAGDLISGNGTIAVVPPAGSMGDYMRSLYRVRELEIDIIYPGHGPAISNGNERIEQYIERRESREEEIYDAVASGLDSSEEITKLLYPKVEPRIQRAAEGTVRGHLLHLSEQARIRIVSNGANDPRYVLPYIR